MKWLRLTQSSSSLTAQSDKALRIFEISGGFALIVVTIGQKHG
jgi:hypothetical protein